LEKHGYGLGQKKLIELYAGGYGEWRFCGKANDEIDREYAGLLAGTATNGWRQQAALIREAEAKARQIVERHWAAIEDLAAAVLSAPTRLLEADEIW